MLISVALVILVMIVNSVVTIIVMTIVSSMIVAVISMEESVVVMVILVILIFTVSCMIMPKVLNKSSCYIIFVSLYSRKESYALAFPDLWWICLIYRSLYNRIALATVSSYGTINALNLGWLLVEMHCCVCSPLAIFWCFLSSEGP